MGRSRGNGISGWGLGQKRGYCFLHPSSESVVLLAALMSVGKYWDAGIRNLPYGFLKMPGVGRSWFGGVEVGVVVVVVINGMGSSTLDLGRW